MRQKTPPTHPRDPPNCALRAVLCIETKVARYFGVKGRDFGVKCRDWTGNLKKKEMLQKRRHRGDNNIENKN